MRTRQQFEDSVKDEIAHGWYYRLMTSKEIEARGIKMNNVYRWMTERFGPGPRPPAGTVPPPKKNGAVKEPPSAPKNGAVKDVSSDPTAAANLELQSLRKIKRGANGRYPDQARDKITPLLIRQVPVPEIAERTGINPQTLYLWRDAAQKKNGAAQKGSKNGGALVVVPKAAAPARVQRIKAKRVKYGELLTNDATTKAMLDAIDMKEDMAWLEKHIRELDAAHRAGEIELDYRDHRLMMVVKRMIGAPIRGARR